MTSGFFVLLSKPICYSPEVYDIPRAFFIFLVYPDRAFEVYKKTRKPFKLPGFFLFPR